MSGQGGTAQQEGAAVNLMGNVYRKRGQLDKAEEFYKKALDVAVSAGDPQRKGRALKCLGDVDSLKGNPGGALESTAKPSTSQNSGDSQGVGYTLQGTGRAEMSLGQDDKAAEHFQKALEASQRTGNVRDQARAHGQLGRMYQSWGPRPARLSSS